MPVPVSSIKITCNACGSSKIVRQNSDVIILPAKCEHCGSSDLSRSAAVLLCDFKLLTLLKNLLKT